ncbi:MAG: hypothetical protein ACJA02_000685 [Myxococcota bacterium]|jgi:hypothetical protein
MKYGEKDKNLSKKRGSATEDTKKDEDRSHGKRSLSADDKLTHDVRNLKLQPSINSSDEPGIPRSNCNTPESGSQLVEDLNSASKKSSIPESSPKKHEDSEKAVPLKQKLEKDHGKGF